MEREMNLEERLQELTTRMIAMEQDLAVIKATYATKADVLAAKNSIIMWVVGAVIFSQVLPLLLKRLGG
jgi:hypothetical protein